jgi:hypothetical protein
MKIRHGSKYITINFTVWPKLKVSKGNSIIIQKAIIYRNDNTGSFNIRCHEVKLHNGIKGADVAQLRAGGEGYPAPCMHVRYGDMLKPTQRPGLPVEFHKEEPIGTVAGVVAAIGGEVGLTA